MYVHEIDSFLFLDIDGVMSKGKASPYLRTRQDFEDRENAFAPKATENLNALLNHFPGLGIVMSSQIRLGKSHDEVNNFFKLRGVDPNRIIGRTPGEQYFTLYPDTHYEVRGEVCRGQLIDFWKKSWVKKHESDPKSRIRDYQDMKYLIIDDSVDMLYYQKDYFVKCTHHIGFTTPRLYDKAVQLLKKQGAHYD